MVEFVGFCLRVLVVVHIHETLNKMIKYFLVSKDSDLIVGIIVISAVFPDRWLHPSLFNKFPINRFKERMVLNLIVTLCSKSFLRIPLHKPLSLTNYYFDQAFSVIAHVFRKLELGTIDVIIEDINII